MNKLWVVLIAVTLILGCGAGFGLLHAQVVGGKLWTYRAYTDGFIHVYFTQDLETGTRCYIAQTTGNANDAPVAMTCIPKGAK